MLTLIEPEGMNPAVVGGKKYFHDAIAVQIGGNRIGLGTFYNRIIFTQRCSCVFGRLPPIPSAHVQSAPVGIENKQRRIFSRRMAMGAVVHIAGNDNFHRAVVIEIGCSRRTMGQICPVSLRPVGRAVSPAANLDCLALPQPDLAPALAAITGVGRKLSAGIVIGRDIMDIRRHDYLAAAVPVQICDPCIVVEHAVGVSG